MVFGAVTNLMLRGGSGDELVLEPPSQFADQAPARFSPYAEPVLRLHVSEAFACRNTRSKDGCGSFAKALRAAMSSGWGGWTLVVMGHRMDADGGQSRCGNQGLIGAMADCGMMKVTASGNSGGWGMAELQSGISSLRASSSRMEAGRCGVAECFEVALTLIAF